MLNENVVKNISQDESKCDLKMKKKSFKKDRQFFFIFKYEKTWEWNESKLLNEYFTRRMNRKFYNSFDP